MKNCIPQNRKGDAYYILSDLLENNKTCNVLSSEDIVGIFIDEEGDFWCADYEELVISGVPINSETGNDMTYVGIGILCSRVDE